MSAPVLNLGFLSPASTAGTASASAPGQTALAGFEALLAALFGPVDAQGPAAPAETTPAQADLQPMDESADGDVPPGAEAQMMLGLLAEAAPQGAPQAEAEIVDAPVEGAETQPPGAGAKAAPDAAAEDGFDPAAFPKPAATQAAVNAETAPVAASPAKSHAAPPAPVPGAEPAAAPAAPAPEAATEAAAEAVVPQPQAPTRGRSETTDHRREARAARSDDRPDAVSGLADDGLPLRPAPQTAATRPGPAEPAGLTAAGDAPAPESAQSEAPKTQGPAGPAPGAAAHAPPLPEHAQGLAVRGAPETVAHLAANILKKLEGRSTRFDVELEPAGLGRVDIRVEIAANGRLTAAMAFDNPQAAAEVRGRAGELARALEQAGFDLSGGLSFDVAGDQGRPRQDGQDGGQALRGRAFQAMIDAVADAPELAPAGALYISRRSAAGLDIRI